MKTFYASVLGISLLLLILFCTPSVPSKLRFVDRLVLHADKWELKFDDPDRKIFRDDEASGKAKLLEFIDRYRLSYKANAGWLASGLAVAAAFSLLGRARETKFAKLRAERTSVTNKTA